MHLVESITLYLQNSKREKLYLAQKHYVIIERMVESSNRELEVYDYDSYYLKLERERKPYELKTTIE